MSKYVIHKSFFKQNPLDKMSAATIADYSLSTLFLDDLNAEIEKIINSQIMDERKERILADKIAAEQLTSGEDVVTYMRKNHDNLADPVFCKRALMLEAEAAPLIVKRYKTSAQDRFIELAFRVLAKADKKYAQQLFYEYKEIRNPYAQSMACLLFGEHEMEESVPLLIQEYKRFKQSYPKESFNQAPLLALYILYGEA